MDDRKGTVFGRTWHQKQNCRSIGRGIGALQLVGSPLQFLGYVPKPL
jgi:hypothetical protein